MNARTVLAIVIALAVPVSSSAALDCSRAQSNADKMLCSSSRLSEADDRLALAFRGAIRRGADPKLLMESQRAWIHDSRDVCIDVECMLRAYEERISDLDNR